MFLTVDIKETPPTSASIDRYCNISGAANLTGLVATVIGLAMLAFDLWHLMNRVDTSFALFMIGTLLFSFGVATIATFSVSGHHSVEASDCEELLKLCESTPEGQIYRDAVLKQGREFVIEELEALRAWDAQSRAELACKKLYCIPSSN